MIDIPEELLGPGHQSEMTTLDGLVICLSAMRWSDGLVVRPTDAASWEEWATQFHGLVTIIDAVVAQARTLSRTIHGEDAIQKAEPKAYRFKCGTTVVCQNGEVTGLFERI